MQKVNISENQAKSIARTIHEDIFNYCNLHSARFEEFKEQQKLNANKHFNKSTVK